MDTPLRKLRLRKGLTLTEVAQATAIDVGNLSRIETRKQLASSEYAERLAKFYAGEISELQIIYPERYMRRNSFAERKKVANV